MKYLALLTLATLTMPGCRGRVDFDSDRTVRTYHEAVDGTGAKELEAVFHLGAGKLRLTRGGAKLFEADIETTGRRPDVDYRDGQRARLDVSQKNNLNFGNNENEWDVRLGDAVPLDLELHLGAGEADLDLADLKLRRLVVHMGAGELKLDLRGKYASDVDVEVHGGVGEARIRLPRDMRIDAEASGGLGDIDVHGLTERDGRYTNGVTSGPKMRVEVHGGIGQIELDAR